MPTTEDRIVAALTRLMETGGECPMFVVSIAPRQVEDSFRVAGARVVQDGDVLMVCRPEADDTARSSPSLP